MAPSMYTVVVQFAVSLVIAGFSAWIAVQLALRRFRAEKLWEKRAMAYERLIETIHNAKRFSSEHLEAYYENKELSEDTKSELQKVSRQAEAEIWKATDIGSFLLSESVLDIVKRYRTELGDTKGIQMWHDYLEHDYEVTDRCLKTVIAEAKRHLEIA